MTVAEASKLVQGFEDGTYPASSWTHHAHFVMALWYVYHHPLPEAQRCIKEGIKKYNIMTGGKNTDEAGYHETITEFYIRTIVQYLLSNIENNDLGMLLRQLDKQDFVQKQYPYKFYKKETLMSKRARREWVEPDLKSELQLIQAD